jgi:MiaB-like tRNA modifying enzyme
LVSIAIGRKLKQNVFFKTYGCRTNQFDTQVMINSLGKYDVVEDESLADVIVLNSCTVTNKADASVRSYARKMKKEYPDTKILFSGCGVSTQGKSLVEQGIIDGAFGHSEKTKIDSYINMQKGFFVEGNLNDIDDSVVEQYVGKSRAFIKIQEGCDFSCSFCIIPSVRGKARSSKEENILKQITLLAGIGYSEFILTGTNVGSYGIDVGSNISKLLKKISQIKGVKRVRIGSMEPTQIDDEFIELLDETWMAKHLHIALQHSSDRMLEIMNRKNRVKGDIELFNRISSFGYALGTDYIVGHPGESDDIWREAMTNIREFPLTHIHIFSYSKKDSTKSALMKQVSGLDAKQRYGELKSLISQNNFEFRKQQKAINVLVESKSKDKYMGYDEYYNRLIISSDKHLESKWIEFNDYQVTDEANYAEK